MYVGCDEAIAAQVRQSNPNAESALANDLSCRGKSRVAVRYVSCNANNPNVAYNPKYRAISEIGCFGHRATQNAVTVRNERAIVAAVNNGGDHVRLALAFQTKQTITTMHVSAMGRASGERAHSFSEREAIGSEPLPVRIT